MIIIALILLIVLCIVLLVHIGDLRSKYNLLRFDFMREDASLTRVTELVTRCFDQNTRDLVRLERHISKLEDRLNREDQL